MKRFRRDINADFECLQCGSYVSATRMLACVSNRNHCPYCLWSRHLDLFEAGDRLAACKAPMRPLGLTLKHSHNKYSRVAGGELMLVHLCMACGKISINRIAADDHPDTIMEVYEESRLEPDRLKIQIIESGINLLGGEYFDTVHRQLYGESRQTVLAY
jgi:DNA-directed RNA polymerase subunit RPC12/RpoP